MKLYEAVFFHSSLLRKQNQSLCIPELLGDQDVKEEVHSGVDGLHHVPHDPHHVVVVVHLLVLSVRQEVHLGTWEHVICHHVVDVTLW